MPLPIRPKHPTRGVAAAALLALAGALISCGSEEPAVPDDAGERARAALAPFKKDLAEALGAALREGGPVQAIEVCRLEAPRIAAATARDGIEIGRTSHRLRNPENAPPPWTEPLLREYVANPADEAPRVVRIDAGHVGYVEPIRVKPLCLGCHGEQVAAPVQDRLRELYPGDRATGFRENEFRGLFWVKLPERDAA